MLCAWSSQYPHRPIPPDRVAEVLSALRKNRKSVRVFSGRMEFDLDPNPPKLELPGQWFCPFIAAWITAGGRLLLTILERTVTNADGAYVMCDTDSMAVVSTKKGGLVACAGGQHKLPDGRDAVRGERN